MPTPFSDSAVVLTDQQREQLRAARLAAGLTQADLAERLGVGLQFVSQLETGFRAPDPGGLRRWALAVGLKAEIEVKLRD